ncbi:MAG: type V CRISPR-associated protein Cas12b, partial [Candidatus Sericytochromatia bacterium]|nr:type V CRISPR-associated protein Cas12b [Candidatus Sericytochromatia bacterium]
GRHSVTAELVEAKARSHAKGLRERAGKAPADLPAEAWRKASELLRKYYAMVVPSVVEGESGSAQGANAYCSPLIDAESKGGMQVREQADAPAWLEAKLAGKGWEKAAKAWIAEELKQRRTGNPTAWRKQAIAKPEALAWVPAYEKWRADKEAEVKSGAPEVSERLRDLGLLPWALDRKHVLQAASATVASQLGSRDAISPWDRGAFRQAVSHLLAWESWNHRAANERKAATEAVEKEDAGLAAMERGSDRVRALRAYEDARWEELKRVSLADDRRRYVITRRATRGMERICSRWQKALEKDTKADLWAQFAEEQARDPRGVGDPDLYRWLAQPPQRALWQADGGTLVEAHAKAEDVRSRQRAKRPTATLTPAQACLHPRWAGYESGPGGNVPGIRLKLADERLTARMPMLGIRDGRLEQVDAEVPLAPSGQFCVQSLSEDRQVHFVQAPSVGRAAKRLNAAFEGTLGGMELMLKREDVRRPKAAEAFEASGVARAYLKVVLDIAIQPVDARLLSKKGDLYRRNGTDRHLSWATPLLSAKGKALSAKVAEAADVIRPGLRVMGVDLGVRTAAAVVSYELHANRDANPDDLRVEVGSRVLLAREVPGSARLLAVPGEKFLVDGALRLMGSQLAALRPEAEARATARFEAESAVLLLMRRGMRRRRQLLRLSADGLPEDRRKELAEALAEGPTRPEPRLEAAFAWLTGADEDARRLAGVKGHEAVRGCKKATAEVALEKRHVAVLESVFGFVGLEPKVARSPKAALATWDEALRAAVRVWRKRSRRRDPLRQDIGGKSLRWIGHLEQTRRFLLGWGLQGERSGHVRRQAGEYSPQLLEHIAGLKDDRLKTVADLIVQAARGLSYDAVNHEWVEHGEPCHLIVMEDLARYRFKTDRPPAENGQLMQWSHRELVEKVVQQAELFGIGVVTAGAGFSSRYSGRTGAPGVRCRKVTQADLEAAWFKEALAARYARNRAGEPDPARLKAGDLIPWEGGEWFASPSGPKGELELEQADVNAARSIARRLLTRHGEAFRFVGRLTRDGDGAWQVVPQGALGARMAGALGAAEGVLHLGAGGRGGAGTDAVPEVGRFVPGTRRKARGSDDPGTGGEDDEGEALEAESLETAGRRPVTFFADPSGVLWPAGQWVDRPKFWGVVRSKVLKALRDQGQCHG